MRTWTPRQWVHPGILTIALSRTPYPGLRLYVHSYLEDACVDMGAPPGMEHMFPVLGTIDLSNFTGLEIRLP
jgi:hypothetical protein